VLIIKSDYKLQHIGYIEDSECYLNYKTQIKTVDAFNLYVLNYIYNNRNCDLFKSDKIFELEDLKCTCIGHLNYEETNGYLFVQKSNSKTRLLCYFNDISISTSILNNPTKFQQKINSLLKDESIQNQLKDLGISNIENLIFGI